MIQTATMEQLLCGGKRDGNKVHRKEFLFDH